MKHLFIILLFISSLAEAVSASIFSNAEIKESYGIRIELAEKSVGQCNDIVIYAPLKITEQELGALTLEKIESSLHSLVPGSNEVLESSNLIRYSYEQIEGSARVLTCVNKSELEQIYFRFLYVNPGSPSVVLVAPLMLVKAHNKSSS